MVLLIRVVRNVRTARKGAWWPGTKTLPSKPTSVTIAGQNSASTFLARMFLESGFPREYKRLAVIIGSLGHAGPPATHRYLDWPRGPGPSRRHGSSSSS